MGMKLREDNRWVKKAQTIPWNKIESRYANLFPSSTGNVAKPLQAGMPALMTANHPLIVLHGVFPNNPLLFGATGSGKTYIACALGMSAVCSFLPVKYIRFVIEHIKIVPS